MKKNWTRKDSENELNDIGTPPDDLKSNGGRISDKTKYGTWLRKNDPIAFNVYHNEQISQIEFDLNH